MFPYRVLLAAALLLPGVAHAQVFLKAAEQGQGILRSRGGECFVLTPEHVVGGASSVAVISEFRREGSAQVEATFPGDLALLRVDPTPPMPCPGPWDSAEKLQDRLASSSEATLESRNEDGSLQRRFVRVTSHDSRYITVRPTVAADALFRGLSGSLLRIAGTPAGMLLRVDAESGEGIVLREDHLSDVVRSFFDVSIPAAALAANGYTIDAVEFKAVVTERTVMSLQPDQLASSIATLEVGAVVRVTGRIKERLWYRVVTDDGRTGFVPTRALQKL